MAPRTHITFQNSNLYNLFTKLRTQGIYKLSTRIQIFILAESIIAVRRTLSFTDLNPLARIPAIHWESAISARSLIKREGKLFFRATWVSWNAMGMLVMSFLSRIRQGLGLNWKFPFSRPRWGFLKVAREVKRFYTGGFRGGRNRIEGSVMDFLLHLIKYTFTWADAKVLSLCHKAGYEVREATLFHTAERTINPAGIILGGYIRLGVECGERFRNSGNGLHACTCIPSCAKNTDRRSNSIRHAQASQWT